MKPLRLIPANDTFRALASCVELLDGKIALFITDPERSQCRDIANTDLSQIENPSMPDRTAWLERISQFHWSHEELQLGVCWSHMKKWAKK